MAKDKKRAQEVENMRSNVDMVQHLDEFKSEMVSIIAKVERLYHDLHIKTVSFLHVYNTFCEGFIINF